MKPVLPFIMAGSPGLEKLSGYLAEAAELKLDAIEVGLPHSDPIADGPVLQAAGQLAIAAGVTPMAVIQKLAGCSPSAPVVLFTYLNPLLQIGAKRLIELLRPTPVRSLLIVDLPFGEEPEFEAELRAAGYPIVPLLAPTTDLGRAARLLAERPDPGEGAPFAQRFVYVVARLGVTGTGQPSDLAPVRQRVADLRRVTARPLVVGFGLSDTASLDAVRAMGAVPVVGSALVKALQSGNSLRGALTGLGGTA